MKSKILNFGDRKSSEEPKGPLYAEALEHNTKVEEGLKEEDVVNMDQKMNLKTTKVVNRKKKKSRLTKLLIGLLIIFLIFGGLAYFFVIQPVQRVLGYVDDIKLNALNLAKDFESKDLTSIDAYFNNIQEDLTNIDVEISKYDFLATLDMTKGYYNNFQIVRGILRKSSNVIEDTLPEFKEILKSTGFKVEKGEVLAAEPEDEEAEEKGALTLILKDLSDYLKLYDGLEPRIIDILADVKKIDLNYVPEYGDYNFKEQIQSAYKFIDEFPETSARAKNFIKYLPNLVGADDPADYLLILQNETEMRASGGLLTAFGHASMHEGAFGEEIVLSDSWNFQYDLWAVGRPMPYSNIYGQNYLMNLGCGANELRVQDAGIYPDLYVTASMIKDYYAIVQPNFPEDYPDYDYILTLNLAFAESLLELIQPLEVEGYGQVDAEGLYSFIKGETDKNLPNETRKDIIKEIANAAKEKFLNLPVEKLPEVIKIVIRSFQAKDIAIAAPDDIELQAYLDDYGMSGRIEKEFDGDYFHLNEAQNCSLKLNKFIRNNVTQDIFIEEDGSVRKAVLIKWQQTKVFEPGLEDQYSPSLSFSYRAWVRVIAPVGVESFESDGFLQSGYIGYYPQKYYDDILNKEVSDNIIQFDHRRLQESDPVERKEMKINYKLPSDINYNEDKNYTMLIQKHPGKSWGEQYYIKIHHNGEVYSLDFVLDRDKVLTYKNGVITVDNFDQRLDWVIDLTNNLPMDKLAK